jgi:hypothetical protein
MAISASFLYSAAKFIMLGRGSLGAESVASLSLSASASIRAAIILESHTTDKTASTTTSLRNVFTSRAASGNAGFLSQSADALLLGATITSTSTDGTVAFDASDVATPSVSTGQSVGGILIYKSVGGVDATSIPIALIDIGSPVTTNGASININWDNSKNLIFSLT